MRRPVVRHLAATVFTCVCVPSALRAQAWQTHLLSPIAGATGRCTVTPARDVVPGEQANRIVSLRLDGEPARVLSVTTNGRGTVATFATSATTRLGADGRATQSLAARFDGNGRLLAGERTSSVNDASGVPRDAHREALSADDAAEALQLARALMGRCVHR